MHTNFYLKTATVTITVLTTVLHLRTYTRLPKMIRKKCKTTATELIQTEITNTIFWSNKSSAVAEMGDRLATIDMGRKVGRGCCGGAGSSLGHHLTQSGLGRGLPLYKWHLDPSNHLATAVGMPHSST